MATKINYMYKKGDRLVCVDIKGIGDGLPITIGKIYTVTEDMRKDDLCVMVITDSGKPFGYYSYRYRLAIIGLNENTRTL